MKEILNYQKKNEIIKFRINTNKLIDCVTTF